MSDERDALYILFALTVVLYPSSRAMGPGPGPGTGPAPALWRRVQPETALPFALVPLALVTGAASLGATLLVLVALAMSLLYLARRPRAVARSRFFYSWTLSSAICLFLVFEFDVLSLLEITQAENLLFLVLLISALYSFYTVRSIAEDDTDTIIGKGKDYSPVLTSDCLHCPICQIEINNRYFHSIWLDCCISSRNYRYYLAGMCFADICLLYAADLGLTTVCQPYVFYGTILMPEDCSDVYYDFDLALCFVACIYGLGYAGIITLTLVHQCFKYLPRNIGNSWKKSTNVLSA